jgi:predicted permease
MESFIFALSAVSPIIITVAIGYFIKRIGLVGADFAKSANKLVFRIFLPTMLFLNVYRIESIASLELGYMIYGAVAVVAVFLISIPLVIAVTKRKGSRGALLQACFRSNYALIGIPLAQSLFGEKGMAVATLLSLVSIPLLNVCAVISLSIFKDGGEKPNVGKILLGIVKNPLIQSITIGIAILGVRAIFAHYSVSFRLSEITALIKVLTYLSNLATPLALLMLGVQFEFSAVSELKNEIIFGTAMRTVIVPLLGLGVAFLFFRKSFGGAHFAAFIALFATPVSVSSVPMAQEMGGDHTLAGQLVVWTTLVSAVTVFIASFLLKAAGVF